MRQKVLEICSSWGCAKPHGQSQDPQELSERSARQTEDGNGREWLKRQQRQRRRPYPTRQRHEHEMVARGIHIESLKALGRGIETRGDGTDSNVDSSEASGGGGDGPVRFTRQGLLAGMLRRITGMVRRPQEDEEYVTDALQQADDREGARQQLPWLAQEFNLRVSRGRSETTGHI